MTFSRPHDSAKTLATSAKSLIPKDQSTRREVKSILSSMNFGAGWSRMAKARKYLCLPYLNDFSLNRATLNGIPQERKEHLTWWKDPQDITHSTARNPARYLDRRIRHRAGCPRRKRQSMLKPVISRTQTMAHEPKRTKSGSHYLNRTESA